MKTTDLIPLILLELNDSDKYGFELTKSIESKSQGKIVIKQPTLYTILKKLEKSKFISSYWEDSDIGGKRHYYKITDNGKMQVSTLPSFSVLISNILSNETETLLDSFAVQKEVEEKLSEDKSIDHSSINQDNISSINDNEISNDTRDNIVEDNITSSTSNSFSIMDMISSENQEEAINNPSTDIENSLNLSFEEKDDKIILCPELKETIVPTSEIFEETNIDNLTENEINQSNIEVVKEDSFDKFASNENVSAFAEKQPKLTTEYKEKIKTSTSIESLIKKEEPTTKDNFNFQDVRYVDYVNFTTDKKHINAKMLSNKLTLNVCISTLYLFAVILLSSLFVKLTHASPLFYISIIVSCVILIFYPALHFSKREKQRLHLINNKYKYDFKKHLIIILSIEFTILLTCIIVNIAIGNYSIIKMFTVKNFANIYAEILISSALFVDLLVKYLLMKKYINRE